jgi:hypothetical protein
MDGELILWLAVGGLCLFGAGFCAGAWWELRGRRVIIALRPLARPRVAGEAAEAAAAPAPVVDVPTAAVADPEFPSRAQRDQVYAELRHRQWLACHDVRCPGRARLDHRCHDLDCRVHFEADGERRG